MERIVIINFGAQYNQLIARRVREAGVYSELLPPDSPIEKIKGGPVSERVQDFCYRIGSILLVLLMGLALFNDFSRL